MALEIYRKKRNFRTTPEPRGRIGTRKSRALRFVIQKHAARQLHYDFRLELNGVLLSWAVPKGPSLDPHVRRLALHVEDHPIEYGDFEGIIPPKQYGSGTVMLWDLGTWEPVEDAESGYHKGKLKFVLHGEKLGGGWTLVRTRSGKYGGDKAWLLIKENDEHARPGEDSAVVEGEPDSVASGRSMDEIAASADRVWRSDKSVAENVKSGAVARRKPARAGSKKTATGDGAAPGGTPAPRRDAPEAVSGIGGARPAALPDFVEPELATLVKEAPGGPDWLHEMKLDGYRMLARIERGKVRLYTRNRNDWTAKFPAIAKAVAALPVDTAWLDGEIVVMQASGLSSFQSLQNALSGDRADSLLYYVFDLPYLDGYDLRNAALLERKRLLEAVLPAATGALRYSSHVLGQGENFFAQACQMKLEGVIAKRAASPYRADRGRDWLKIKCFQRQEMVIGGFTDPEGSRKGFGALLLGVYERDGKLRYSGKVGTGFNDAVLAGLRRKLDALAQDEPAFANPPRGAEARRSHWVKPELVAEIAFTEWTEDGTLRHPSFQGLREDKKARDVVREHPLSDSSGAKASERSRHAAEAARPRRPAALRVPRRKKTSATTATRNVIAGVTLSHPDKQMYSEAGITKRDLALYYEAIAERILPHLRDRPLTLVRCPNGWQKQCFYQKHAKDGASDVIDRVTVPEGRGKAFYMMANSLSAVVAFVQMGVLEFHPWGASAQKLGSPDRIIFDIDPDDDLPWRRIVEAVRLVQSLLDEIGLRGFLKTTGGKGLHVVVPIRPTHSWGTIKGFAKAVAELFAATFPDRFISTMSKAQRRGKIFIDYLRNAEGATAIAAYSIRARSHAPVSTPIGWDELDGDVRFDRFNLRNVPERLERTARDPWADFFRTSQTVTAAMLKKVGGADA
ncbi:MAG TPA: DNA ligase D [Burkholderiales bacterium]|nr:DNA ligase D [Burkholderiales bacterium]